MYSIKSIPRYLVRFLTPYKNVGQDDYILSDLLYAAPIKQKAGEL